VDKLMNMYEKKMEECEEILARLEGNVYNQNLTGVLLAKDRGRPDSVEMTKADYQLLVDLAEEGFLHPDDFSIATGMRSALFRRLGERDPDDNSTIGTYQSSSDEESEEESSDDSSGSSYYAPSSRSGSVFSSAQNSRQSGHHSHSSRGSDGSGLVGGRVYKIPQQQRIHGGLPLRYY
jgi:hypothetical protein